MTPQMMSDAKQGLVGVAKLLAGQSDYHGHFDITVAGMARSFTAALIALPFALLNAGVTNALAAQAVGQIDVEAARVSLPHALTRWLLMWAYFPLLAAGLTRLIGRRERFAPWISVHNWTHLMVVLVQTVPIVLLGIGAAGPGGVLLIFSIVFAAYAYVRAAGAALEVGPALAIGAGTASMLATLAISVLTQELFVRG